MEQRRSCSISTTETVEHEPGKMKLTLLDRETGESRPFTLAEAKTWDWKDPDMWRMIGDWQISSYETLVQVLAMKLEYGREEVVLIVAPRFAMLAGG